MIRFIPRRYWAVIAVALALIMSVLDGTIVNVALPTLSREFGTSPSSTIWIVNAYQLTITMSIQIVEEGDERSPLWEIFMDISGFS